MFKRTLVLRSLGAPSAQQRRVSKACVYLASMQDRYVFRLSEIKRRDTLNHYDWLEDVSGDGWIRLIDDFSIRAQYLEIAARTSRMLNLVCEGLCHGLDIIGPEELKQNARAAANDPHKAHALLLLAFSLSDGKRDYEARDILIDALESRDLYIRDLAIRAIGLLKWPEFSGALITSITQERDASLSEKMSVALAYCEAL